MAAKTSAIEAKPREIPFRIVIGNSSEPNIVRLRAVMSKGEDERTKTVLSDPSCNATVCVESGDLIPALVDFFEEGKCECRPRGIDLQAIAPSGAERFGRDIYSFPSLERIILNSNVLGAPQQQILLQYPRASHITELHLRGCKLGDQGIRQLASTWPFKSLVMLLLAQNGISHAGTNAVAKLLLESTLLETVSLAENDFGATGDPIVARALQKLPSLRTVDSVSVPSDREGPCWGLRSLLQNHKYLLGLICGQQASSRQLTDIDLSDNGFVGAHWSILEGLLLSKLSSIRCRDNEGGASTPTPEGTSVGTSGTSVGTPGASAGESSLASFLARISVVSALQAVDIGGTRVGSEGWEVLGQSRRLTAVKSLKVDRTSLSDSECAAFSILLRVLPSLIDLDVSGNAVSENGLAILMRELRRLKHLSRLAVRGNRLGNSTQALRGMIDALSEETEAEMMTTEAESQPGDDRAGAEAGGPGGVVLEGEDGARAGRSAPAWFQSLGILDLAENSLGPRSVAWVKALLRRTVRLIALDLGGCDLGTSVKELGPCLAGLTGLREIRLQMNAYGQDGAVGIVLGLEQNKGMTCMDLAFNCMMPTGMAVVLPALAQQVHLTHLDLMGNAVEDEGCRLLAAAVQRMPSLKHLNLANNLISTEGAVVFLEALSSHSALVTLDLSKNAIGVAGLEKLGEIMPTLSSLEEISIERNAEDEEREGSRETQEMQTVTVIEHGVGVDPHGDLKGLKLLAESAGSHPCLRKFNALTLKADATSNALCCTHLQSLSTLETDVLAAAIRSHTSLTSLNGLSLAKDAPSWYLQNCIAKFYLYELPFVANRVNATSSLVELGLAHNFLGPEGTTRLCSLFDRMPQLTKLDLAHNDPQQGGVSALAASLRILSNLKTLILARNNLVASECGGLFKAICTMPSLLDVSFKYNSLMAEGAASLAQHLPMSKSLTALDVGRCQLRDEGCQALAKAISQVPSIQALDLSDNMISNLGVAAISASIPALSSLHTLNLVPALVAMESVSPSLRPQPLAQDVILELFHAFSRSSSLKAVVLGGKMDLVPTSVGTSAMRALHQNVTTGNGVLHPELRVNNVPIGPMICNTIQELQLVRTQLCPFDVGILAEGIIACSSLTAIDVRLSLAASDHAALLHSAIKRSLAASSGKLAKISTIAVHPPADPQAITRLDFARFSLGLLESMVLAEVLPRMAELTFLRLSFNPFGSEAGQYLAVGVRALPKLNKLLLADCQLLDAGVLLLAPALASLSSLQLLVLSSNGLTFKSASAVVTAVKQRDGSPAVWLGGNRVDNNEEQRLHKALGIDGSLDFQARLREPPDAKPTPASFKHSAPALASVAAV